MTVYMLSYDAVGVKITINLTESHAKNSFYAAAALQEAILANKGKNPATQSLSSSCSFQEIR
jgi:hypothetical protein